MCADRFVPTYGAERSAYGKIKKPDPYSDYFDRCRRKRNVIDYDDAFVVTATEAKEIVSKAKEFVEVVEQWIARSQLLHLPVSEFLPDSRERGQRISIYIHFDPFTSLTKGALVLPLFSY